MLVKPTQREAAQGIIQLLFCISRGSDNGPCLKRTRRIDERAHHRLLYYCKQAAHKKTSVPEPAVSRVYDGGSSVGELRSATEHQNDQVHLSPSESVAASLSSS